MAAGSGSTSWPAMYYQQASNGRQKVDYLAQQLLANSSTTAPATAEHLYTMHFQQLLVESIL
jgi:hypothetical protein